MQIALPTLISGLLAALLLTGCGAPAAPQPPTLNLPLPVSDLAAARSGNTVRLSFIVPQKTTDKLPVRGAVTARLCRSADGGPCQPAGTVAVKPLQPVVMEDALSNELATGQPRLMAYQVRLENSGGKSAAASNVAYAIAGQAPAPVAGFAATPRRQGIVLSWLPEARDRQPNTGQDADHTAGSAIRFDRVLTAGAPPPAPATPGAMPAEEDEPAQQTLRVPEAAKPPIQQVTDAAKPLAQPVTDAAKPTVALDPPARTAALDATARTGRSYRYIAQRVAHSTVAGHALDMASAPSPPVLVAYRDVFPPPPPTGLVSAVDTPGRAIDLSWSPNQDPHLSGYVVYRRAVGVAADAATPQRLTPPGKPVTVTAWSDSTAVAGQHYAYSVSAVDPSGNERARSAEVEETLPAPDSHP